MYQTAKQQAKAILKDHSPMQYTLAYLAATAGLTLVVNLIMPDFYDAMMSMDTELMLAAVNSNGGLGVFLNILVVVFGVLMSFGYKQWALRVARGGKPPLSSLIEGFGISGKVMMLGFLKFIFVYFWTLCFIVGGTMPLVMMATLLGPAMMGVVSILAVVGAFYVTLWLHARYCLIEFQLSDKADGTAWDAVKQGVQRQKLGFKKIVAYYLSYWRWLLVYLGTQSLYYVFNFVTAYVMSPSVGMLDVEIITDLMLTHNTVAYVLSLLLEWLVLAKILPLFYVGLAVLYDEISVDDANKVQTYRYQNKP